MSVFGRLGYNFDSSKFGDAGNLTSNTQTLLSLTSNNTTFYDWQAVDLGAGSFNRQSYYQNPTASVISQLSANLSSLISIATTLGTPTAPGVYTAITNTAAALAATATSCTFELGRFLSHTSNISGYSSNTSTALVPTYDSMLAVGNQLVMILNKTDGIANTVGLMGAMTSLFISDQLSANNTLINSDYVTINTAGVSTTLTQLNTASAHVSGLNTLLTTRRNADWTFYQNAQQVVKDYSNLTRFSRLSDTQTYMINNMIGTPTLISNITKTTTTPVSYSSSQLTPYASPSGAGAGVGLTQTGVNPGSYIAPLVTVDSYGRTTSIANSTISVDSSGANTTISGNTTIVKTLTTNQIGIGTPTPSYKLDISSADVLGSVAGNQVPLLRTFNNDSNGEYLELTSTRTSNGSDWTTAGIRLQEKIDATWMGWMQFNGNGNQGGITFGTGTSTANSISIPERMRIDNAGSMFLGGTTPQNSAGSLWAKSTAKAWAYLSSGVIVASYNITGVSKPSTGRYLFTMTNAMADTNYAVFVTGSGQVNTYHTVGFIDNSVATSGAYVHSTTQFQVGFWNITNSGLVIDNTYVSVMIFGN